MDGLDSLQLTIAGGVATLTLNRPHARNALDVPMLDALPSCSERSSMTMPFAWWC